MVVGWLLTSYPHAALVPLSRGCASFRALHKVLRQKWRSTVGELLRLSGTSWWLGVGLCRLSVVAGARVETILESNPRVGLTLPNLPILAGAQLGAKERRLKQRKTQTKKCQNKHKNTPEKNKNFCCIFLKTQNLTLQVLNFNFIMIVWAKTKKYDTM